MEGGGGEWREVNGRGVEIVGIVGIVGSGVGKDWKRSVNGREVELELRVGGCVQVCKSANVQVCK